MFLYLLFHCSDDTQPAQASVTNPFDPNFVPPSAQAAQPFGAGAAAAAANFNLFNDDDDIIFEEFVRLRTTGETDA